MESISQVGKPPSGEGILELNVQGQRGASQVKKEKTGIPDKGRYTGTKEHHALEALHVVPFCKDAYREGSKWWAEKVEGSHQQRGSCAKLRSLNLILWEIINNTKNLWSILINN